LFARTLQAFAHDAGLLPSRLDALVVAGDADAARRELHALKGLTATLGLKALSEVAAQAEKMATAPLAARAPELADLISQICERLAGVLPSLTALARQLVADAVVPEVAGTDGVVLLDQLRGLLSALVADDMAAMELHAELRQACGDELADAMAPLDAAMAELNFELAAAECEILMGQLTQ
jgi:HPt (histidine-containing phosphotransfer) domain-containing protein